MTPQLEEQLALLPGYLSDHIQLSLTALAIGITVSIPMALAATRIRKLEWPLMTFANMMQTIPALALLALMVPLLDEIGFLPALLALILYSMLPIIRNTITGIRGVDPALTEAALAMGMKDIQMLIRVELPLAAPVIIAGIRIAAVWVIGIATLSTPVGAPSLGNYIFSGLQTQNYTAVMVGVVAAASLAITLDLLIRLLEKASADRSRLLGLVAAAGLLALILGPFILSADESSREESVRIGTKTFTEQYILAEVLESHLEEGGYSVHVTQSLGSTVVFDALTAGQIDLYVDYSGTIWANHMERSENPGRQEVLEQMTRWLQSQYGIECLGSLGFENAYVLAMREEQARAEGIETIEDLIPVASRFSIGADYEFFSRPEWSSLQEIYGLRFQQRRSFDSALMYRAVAQEEVEVIAAFSTDGRIAAFDLFVLEDNREALPPYDGVLLLAPDAEKRHPGLTQRLQPLIGAISNSEMRNANKLVDVDGRSVGEAARRLEKTIDDEGSVE